MAASARLVDQSDLVRARAQRRIEEARLLVARSKELNATSRRRVARSQADGLAPEANPARVPVLRVDVGPPPGDAPGRARGPLPVRPGQRAQLEEAARDGAGRRQRVARALLLLADGRSAADAAGAVGVSAATTRVWARRWRAGEGYEQLAVVAPGRGRKPTVRRSIEAAVLVAVRQGPPPPATRWTLRALADASGGSKDTVARLLRARGISLD